MNIIRIVSKTIGVILTVIIFIVSFYMLTPKFDLYTHLLLNIIFSCIIYIIWQLWWLGPICSEITMLIPLVIVSRWNPFDIKTPFNIEELYAWFLCICAFLAGLLGTGFGHFITYVLSRRFKN